MADFRAMANDAEKSKQEWIESKKAERGEINAMQDEGIEDITQDPQKYLMYLNLQSGNPHFSASNIALVMQQRPESTYVASAEKWQKQGRDVTDKAGIKILMPDKYIKGGVTKIGFKAGCVYDVGQTKGKPLAQGATLAGGTTEMEKAVKTLMRLCPVPVKVVDEGVENAMYMEANKQIYLNAGIADTEAFGALANEIIHAKLHDGGTYGGYSREDCELDASSVSYMICRRFGVPRDEPDICGVEHHYSGWETGDKRAALDGLQKMSAEIGDRVGRAIAPPEQDKAKRHEHVK